MATGKKSGKGSRTKSGAEDTQQTNADLEKEVSGAWTVVEETVVDVEEKGTDVINIENIEADESVTPTGKMLYRDTSDKVIAGVCTGLAKSLGWDPTLMRILWIGATFATFGGGVAAYIAFWLLLPSKNAETGKTSPATIPVGQPNTSMLAYALMGVGALILLSNIGVLGGLAGGVWRVLSIAFWPAIMVAIGYTLLDRSSKSEWQKSVKEARTSVKGRFKDSNIKMNFQNKMDGESMRSSFGRVRSNFPLRRSASDRMMMGVCGGLANRLGIDANLIRFGWILLTLFSGFFPGLVAYFVLGILLPEEGVVYTNESPKARQKRQTVQDVQIL